jgi:trk system potassium uptake protein TrkH
MAIDLRPVAHITGLLLVALGAAMLVPMAADLAGGSANWTAFAIAAAVTIVVGALLAIAAAGARGGLSERQAFLLTVVAWVALSLFAALPFMLGAPGLRFVDAVFESTSGITTTGASVIVGLDALPVGTNVWRGLLNWIGGLGVAFVAMIFLPVMRVGGMQFFRVQGFDTMGKALPRAADIARSLLYVYVGLTGLCLMAYLAAGMATLDAVVMAQTTVATGGFAATDMSMGKYPGAAEYVGALFMVLASLPYVRYIQLVAGQPRPLLRDVQVRVFLLIVAGATAAVTLWRLATDAAASLEPTLREALFNLVSIMTTTGYGSGSFAAWGPFAIYVGFLVGLVGGCSGTSSAALSVFRVILLFKAVKQAVLRITAPDRMMPIRYEGRSVDADTLNSAIFFVNLYFLLFGLAAVGITLTGVDIESALFAAWMAIGNIGYGYGPLVAPTATFRDFPDAAKAIILLTLLLGRLGLLSFFVVILPRFWRP